MASERYRRAKADRMAARLFACPQCVDGKRFATRARMELHLQQVHGAARRPRPTRAELTCAHCGREARSAAALAAHIGSAHPGASGSPGKAFKCPECDSSFAAECYLEQHMHSHNERKIHKCEECGK